MRVYQETATSNLVGDGSVESGYYAPDCLALDIGNSVIDDAGSITAALQKFPMHTAEIHLATILKCIDSGMSHENIRNAIVRLAMGLDSDIDGDEGDFHLACVQ